MEDRDGDRFLSWEEFNGPNATTIVVPNASEVVSSMVAARYEATKEGDSRKAGEKGKQVEGKGGVAGKSTQHMPTHETEPKKSEQREMQSHAQGHAAHDYEAEGSATPDSGGGLTERAND